ncbi:MAG: triose-phosphate isomerase [Spongiibacteraceae bacterium]|nr:triose-phosphate isomerase [Spongiibacteraceae bacterium]
MRGYLVVGNWKMHGSKATAETLVTDLRGCLLAGDSSCEVVVCPPAIFIPAVAQSLAGSTISLGAQNIHDQREGAYTGEISAVMLADFKCRYVIIGHSERRTLFAETDAQVAAKFLAAKESGIIPIVCLGESLEKRESGQTLNWIEQQLQSVIDVVGVEALSNAVLAYEPIWAIGTGKTATPDQAQEVHAHIRQFIAKVDQQVAQKIQILYGGSVNAKNAVELFGQSDIDGALVGGASLKAQDFAQICKAAV